MELNIKMDRLVYANLKWILLDLQGIFFYDIIDVSPKSRNAFPSSIESKH